MIFVSPFCQAYSDFLAFDLVSNGNGVFVVVLFCFAPYLLQGIRFIVFVRNEMQEKTPHNTPVPSPIVNTI